MTRPLVLGTCVGVAALLMYAAGLAPELTPRTDIAQDFAFQVTDPVWLQRALPRLGGPESWWPSGLLSAAWSRLPASWSLNLLSAAMAATAAALLSIIVTGWSGPVAGAVAGAGFAMSPAVWATAVAAEGDIGPPFLLVHLLVALACIRTWARTGRRRPLAWAAGAMGVAAAQDPAVGLAAISLLATMAPGDRRARWFSVAVATLVGAGAYHWWAMGALLGPPAGDTPSPAVAEAWLTMWRWGFPPDASAGAVVQARSAALASVLMDNVGALGGIVATLGVGRSVPFLAGMSAVALAAIAGPVPGAWDPSTRVLLPLAAMWGLVGLGIVRAASWTQAGGRPVALALSVLLPAIQAVRTTAEAPQLIDRPAGQLLHAFDLQQTEPASVVVEGTRVARLLRWANQRRMPSRRFDLQPHDPGRISALMAGGATVLATDAAADRLSLSGFNGPPFPVFGRPLDDLLRSIAPGALVGFAATAGAFEGHPDARRAVERLATNVATGGLAHDDPLVLLARPADGNAHLVSSASGAAVPSIREAASSIDPSLLPGDGARLVTDTTGARLEREPFELAHVERGAILAAWSPRDGSLDWSVLDLRRGLSAPWVHERWTLSRLTRHGDCATVGPREWMDVTSLGASARVGVEIPRARRLRLYLARDRDLFVRVAAFPDRPSPVTSIVWWDRTHADQASAAAAALEADGLPAQLWPEGARFLWQVTAAATDAAPSLLAVGLGGHPDWMRVRLESPGESDVASLCAGVAGIRLFARAGQREDSISLAHHDSFGAGWSGHSRAGLERWREIEGLEADLLARIDVPAAMAITLAARTGTPGPRSPGRVQLRVNRMPTDAQDLVPGKGSYTWTVPRDHWREGTNRIVVMASPGPGDANRLLDLQVTSIRFRRSP